MKKYLSLGALVLASFLVSAPFAQAATLHSTASSDITQASPDFSSGVIDASAHENLTFSFSYDAEDLDDGDSFKYGWKSGSVENDLATVNGADEGGPAGDETNTVNVVLPTEAEVSDLEIYIRLTANAAGDNVNLTSISVDGDEVVSETISIVGGESYLTLQEAIDDANPDGSDTIELSADLTLSEQVTVDKPLTINGNGHTLFASFPKTSNSNNSAIGVIQVTGAVVISDMIIDGTGGSAWPTQLHGVNVYRSDNVVLDSVTITNFGGSGIVVNGSNVTATNLNTSGNSWNAVNVDPGSGVTEPSVFTLNSGTLDENVQIWSDGTNVTETATVTVNAEGYTQYSISGTPKKLWTNKALTNAVTIEGANVIYLTLQAAIAAAVEGDTIVVGSGTYNENVNVNKSVSLHGANFGVDARTRSTSNESVVDGGGTTATFQINADNVVVDGFTIKGGYNGLGVGVYALGQHNNVFILNNVVTDNAIGVYPSGDSFFIGNNLFDSNNRPGSAGGAGIYTDIDTNGLVIDSNEFVGHTENNPVIFAATAPAVHQNVEFTNNNLDNEFGIYILSVATGDFSGNIINTNGATALSFSGGNTDITITSNTMNGNARGVRVEDAGFGFGANGNVAIHNNSIASNSDYGVGLTDAGYLGELDATQNWWGNSTGPTHTSNAGGTGDEVSDNVSFNPWCADEGCSAFFNGTEVTNTLPDQVLETTITPAGNVEIEIPDGTTITGGSNWNGVLTLPTITTSFTLTAESGFSATPTIALEVGAGDVALILDNAAKLTFAEQSGNFVGWSRAGVFTPITETCDSLTTPTLAAGADCKIIDGSDLVVWTKHFTVFVTYQQTPNPPRRSSGSSATPAVAATPAVPGVSPAVPATPAVPAVPGQVLGAEKFNFTLSIKPGPYKVSLQGNEVMELQKLLNALGFNSGAVDGKYGPITRGAVIRFQVANGLVGDGIVGPLTRAVLNK